jgi:hypothetical protein
MDRSGSAVRILQMYSHGVRPPGVLRRRAELRAARKSARCVRRRAWPSRWKRSTVSRRRSPGSALGLPSLILRVLLPTWPVVGKQTTGPFSGPPNSGEGRAWSPGAHRSPRGSCRNREMTAFRFPGCSANRMPSPMAARTRAQPWATRSGRRGPGRTGRKAANASSMRCGNSRAGRLSAFSTSRVAAN